MKCEVDRIEMITIIKDGYVYEWKQCTRKTDEWIQRLIKHIVLSIHGSFIFDLVGFDATRSRRKKAIVSRRSSSESQSIDYDSPGVRPGHCFRQNFYLFGRLLPIGRFLPLLLYEFKMAAWSSFSNTLAATYRVRKRPETLCKRSATRITYAYP